MTEININAFAYFNSLDGSAGEFLSDEDISKSGLLDDTTLLSGLKDSSGKVTESSVDKWILNNGTAQQKTQISQKIVSELNQSINDHGGTTTYPVVDGRNVRRYNTNFNQEDFNIIDKDHNGEIDYHEWRTAGNVQPAIWGAAPAGGKGLDSDLFFAVGKEQGKAWCSGESFLGGTDRACADFSGSITRDEWSQWIAKQTGQATASGLTAQEIQQAQSKVSEAVYTMRDHVSVVMLGKGSSQFSELYTNLTKEDFAAIDTDNDGFISKADFIRAVQGISEYKNTNNSRIETLFNHIRISGKGDSLNTESGAARSGISISDWNNYVDKQNSATERGKVLADYKTYVNSSYEKSVERYQKMLAQVEIDAATGQYSADLVNGWRSQINQLLQDAANSKTARLATLNAFNVNDPNAGLTLPEPPTAEAARLLSHMNLQALQQTNCAEPEKYTSFTEEDFQTMMRLNTAPSWVPPRYQETFDALKWKIFTQRTPIPEGYGTPGFDMAKFRAETEQPSILFPEGKIPDYVWDAWTAEWDSRLATAQNAWQTYIAKQTAAHPG